MSRTPTKATSSKTKQNAKQIKSKAPKAPLATREMAVARADSAVEEEPMSQITLKLRQSQHRQLAQMAFDAGTTMRGIIMRALKSKGLSVTKDDLKDRRRRC